MKTIKPYILPRPFGGFNIPISIQSIYLKEHAIRNGFLFSLPSVEMTTSGSFLKLENMLSYRFKKYLDISMVSIFALPIENKNLLFKIFNMYKKNNLIKIHALLEKKILTINEILIFSEDIRVLRKLIPSYIQSKNKLKNFKI